jgi:hypothetical protein
MNLAKHRKSTGAVLLDEVSMLIADGHMRLVVASYEISEHGGRSARDRLAEVVSAYEGDVPEKCFGVELSQEQTVGRSSTGAFEKAITLRSLRLACLSLLDETKKISVYV